MTGEDGAASAFLPRQLGPGRAARQGDRPMKRLRVVGNDLERASAKSALTGPLRGDVDPSKFNDWEYGVSSGGSGGSEA